MERILGRAARSVARLQRVAEKSETFSEARLLSRGPAVALDERMGEIPVGGHEFRAVLLERVLVGTVRAQRLPCEDEVGDAADEVLDGRALGIEARRSRMPQRGVHARSLIGRNQETVKPRKSFSKSLLS